MAPTTSLSRQRMAPRLASLARVADAITRSSTAEAGVNVSAAVCQLVLLVFTCVKLSAYASAASALISSRRRSLTLVVSPSCDDQNRTSIACSPDKEPKLSLAMPNSAIPVRGPRRLLVLAALQQQVEPGVDVVYRDGAQVIVGGAGVGEGARRDQPVVAVAVRCEGQPRLALVRRE